MIWTINYTTNRDEAAEYSGSCFSVDKCVLYQEELDEESPNVNAFEKGLNNLIKVSSEKVLTDLHTQLKGMKMDNKQMMVHHTCRKKFADPWKR